MRGPKPTIVLLWLIAMIFSGLKTSRIYAANFSSSDFTVKDPIIDEGLASSSSASFGLGQSLNQVASGKSASADFQLWSGFQYFFAVKQNILTATPGDSQVALSWTVPQTFLGISVASYSLGVGTTSGSYVFQDVGNVTSFTKTGLTPSVQYFFKVEAKDSAGNVLVFSNEATATPTGQNNIPVGGGGGGSTYSGNANIILKGLAYPNSRVFILKDGALAANPTADPGARFNVEIDGLTPGTYDFTVYADDAKGVHSPTLSFYQNLLANTTTTVDNLLIAPSIGVNYSEVKKGDTLTIFGYTVPYSNVNVYVHSAQQLVEPTQSDSSGAWAEDLNTDNLELGDHNSQSQTKTGGQLSPYSRTVSFTVSDTNVPVGYSNKINCDLNNDQRVNLIDLSILLYHFDQPWVPGDFADDGLVDLRDFSILLWCWTG